MIDYQPGDLVIAARDIVCGPVTIKLGTCGIVEYQDRDVCKVQFHGHIVQSNIPAGWLAPTELAQAWKIHTDSPTTLQNDEGIEWS